MSTAFGLQAYAHSTVSHWTGDELRKLVDANQGREILDLSHHNFDGENLDGIVLVGFIMAGASFRKASLVGADLSRADLRGANFEGANLLGAQLVGSNLSELETDSENSSTLRTNLTNAKLDEANLSNARLQRAILKNASLRRAVLRDCFIESADLSDVDFRGAVINNAKFRRQDLGKYIKQAKEHKFGEAQQIYLALKENFLRIGAYDDASWAYVQERSNERSTFFPPYAFEYFGPRELPKYPKGTIHTILSYLGFVTKYFLKWLQSAILYLIWGYGQKPANALLFSIFVVLVFTTIYYFFEGIESSQGVNLQMFDYLVYSMNTFVTNSMDTIKPRDNWFSILTALESMAGVTTLALFAASLGQRMGGR